MREILGLFKSCTSRPVLPVIIIPLIIMALEIWIFGPLLDLPYLFDDPAVLQAARESDWSHIWTELRWPVGYYRPLSLTLWKGADTYLGHHAILVLRGLALALHGVNAILVGLLYSRIGRSHPGQSRFLAMLLFLVFPFSLQAVAYPNAIIHPLVAFLVLSAVYAASIPLRPRIALGLLLAALAPFAAEHGAITGWLILLFAGGMGNLFSKQRLLPQIIYGLMPLGFAALWSLLAAENYMMVRFSLSDWGWNALYLLQGALSPLVRVIPSSWPGKEWGLMLLELAGLALFAIWFRSAGRFRVWAISVGWYMLSIFPVLISRPFIYVMDGPRLMYLGAAGAVWLWTEGIRLMMQRGQRWKLPALFLLGVILALHIATLLKMRTMLIVGGKLTRETLAQIRELPEGRTLVFINYPSWLADRVEYYPIGHEGLSLVPDYVGLGRFIYANLGKTWKVIELSFPDLMKAWRFRFGTLGIWPGWERMAEITQGADDVYIVDYSNYIQPRILKAGGRKPCLSRLAVFGAGALILCEARIGYSHFDSEVKVFTIWMVNAPLREDWTIFLHLYGPDGQLVAQEDGYLIGKTVPLRLMRPGLGIQDIRRLPISREWPHGLYEIALGVYRLDTGERADVHSEVLVPRPDRALRITTLSLP